MEITPLLSFDLALFFGPLFWEDGPGMVGPGRSALSV
jgi:hypothetical protein